MTYFIEWKPGYETANVMVGREHHDLIDPVHGAATLHSFPFDDDTENVH